MKTEFWYPAQKPTRVLIPSTGFEDLDEHHLYYSPRRLIYTVLSDWNIWVYTACGILKYIHSIEKGGGTWTIESKKADKEGNWVTYEHHLYHLTPEHRIVKRGLDGRIIWTRYISAEDGSVFRILHIDSEGNIYIRNIHRKNPGLLAIDGKTGEIKWTIPDYVFPSMISFDDCIIAVDGYLHPVPYEEDSNGYYLVKKINKDTGTKEWENEYTTLYWSTIKYNWLAKGKDDEFYVANATEHYYHRVEERIAKHNLDGRRLWEKEIHLNQFEKYSFLPRASQKDGRVIYQTAGYTVECSDSGGNILYRYSIGEKPKSHYFDSRNRILINKVKLWTDEIQAGVLLSPDGEVEWISDVSIPNLYHWEIAETLPVYALGRDYGREANYNNHYFIEMPHKVEES